jgi:hypothetical protein
MPNSPNAIAVAAGFNGLHLPSQTYSWWEPGFIEHFGGINPQLFGAPAKDYLSKRAITWNITPIEFIIAARAFHVNQFRFEGAAEDPTVMLRWLVVYEKAFDRIEPELAEDELTDEDWKRTEQYSEKFDPRRPRGKRTFLSKEDTDATK